MSKSESTFKRLWPLLVGGTLVTLSSYLYFIKIRSKRSQGKVQVNEDDEDTVNLLLPSFTNASKLAKNLKNLSQHNQLMLYGLYKQALNGNASENPQGKSRTFSFVGRAKFEAWKKFHDMPRHFAMMKYIEVIEHFTSRDEIAVRSNSDSRFELVQEMMDENDIIYENEDEEIEFSDDEGDNLTKKYESSYDKDHDVTFGVTQSTLGGRVTVDEYEDEFEPYEKNSIMFAAATNNTELLKIALDSKDDVDERDANGQSALHIAADKGFASCVKLLLEAGSDPNAVDFEGISVLEAAVIGGSVEVCKILLDAGADPDHEDTDGDTPRTCAEDDSDQEIQDLLREAKPIENQEKSFSSTGTEASQFSC